MLKKAKDDEERFTLEHDAVMKMHRKEEREERDAWARKAAIPPPKPMEKSQDIVDYIKLFLGNMESRDIPEACSGPTLIAIAES